MEDPSFPARHSMIAQAEDLLMAGQIAAARGILTSILAAEPGNAEALYLSGVAHLALHELDAADRAFDATTRAEPSHEDAWLRHGVTLIALTRFDAAAQALRRFLALCPDDAEGLTQYGYCLTCLGDHAAARTALEKAHAQTPEDNGTQFLLASALIWTAGPDAAMRCFEALTARAPDFIAGWYGRSLLHLLLGQYQQGWRMHEWRLKLPVHEGPARIDTHPRWTGAPDQAGKTLLLHADAGLGDILMACRFVPRAAGMRVILRVPRPLARLLRCLPGVAAIVTDTEQLPAFDLQCPIMSLPFALDVTPDGIRMDAPYLWAAPETSARWAKRFAHAPGLLVGIAWAAAPRPGQVSNHAFSQRKSMPLAALAALGAVPGVTFVSLQVGLASAELADPPGGMHIMDRTAEIDDFADTAGIIAHLDLVISVDTSVIHLAGGMGKPAWLMNVFDTDWRWMLNRADSPWYPSVRVFRQPTPGGWDSVVENVAGALRDFTARPA